MEFWKLAVAFGVGCSLCGAQAHASRLEILIGVGEVRGELVEHFGDRIIASIDNGAALGPPSVPVNNNAVDYQRSAFVLNAIYFGGRELSRTFESHIDLCSGLNFDLCRLFVVIQRTPEDFRRIDIGAIRSDTCDRRCRVANVGKDSDAFNGDMGLKFVDADPPKAKAGPIRGDVGIPGQNILIHRREQRTDHGEDACRPDIDSSLCPNSGLLGSFNRASVKLKFAVFAALGLCTSIFGYLTVCGLACDRWLRSALFGTMSLGMWCLAMWLAMQT